MQGVEIMTLKDFTLLELIVLGLKTTNLEILKIIKKEIAERVNEIEIKWEDQKVPNWSSKGQFTK